MKIITPKHYITNEELAGRTVFFLAGPVRGGGDWQAQMCLKFLELESSSDEFICVCPCRWEKTHALATYFLSGDENHFERQLDMERHYLKRAGINEAQTQKGCVVFNLELESKENPHPDPEPYAMDTRGEIAEWRMRMKFESARVVVGGHPDFFGLSQIQRNFTKELGYEFPIYQSMDEIARAAIEMSGI